ncbi:hypothetical protein [Streptomyces tendae]|uniref:hypothetical protein n=1 Tax=Streptomyces tendae TaxID=1932 RepID=UPI00340C8F30
MAGDIWSGALPGFAGFLLTPVGRTWDAVRLPEQLALDTLNAIAGPAGAVLRSPHSHRMYFLVPPHTTKTWDLPCCTVLSDGDHLALPPADRRRPPGPHWLIPPRLGRVYTPTERLHTAVEAALGIRPGRPAEERPDLTRLSTAQMMGFNCALCDASLTRQRKLGAFCTGTGLLV